MLNPKMEAEISELAARYGEPLRWTREFRVERADDAAWVKRLLKRRGEVILLAPRSGQRFLLHTKEFYPSEIYRLPSGGIHQGERIEDAARREAYEEIGLTPELERFIGVVENNFLFDGEALSYPSFIFQINPTDAAPRVMDPDERIADFREVNLEGIEKAIEALDQPAPEWELWGRFRAEPHKLCVAALKEMPNEDRR